MSQVKSLLGLSAILLIICCSCKQRAVEKSDGLFPQTKDSLSAHAHDSIPRVAVYSSSDFGNSWQSVSEGLPDNLQATCIGKVEHELVLATANEGLYITTNNKSSWKDISTGLATKKINTLYVSGDEIYIGLFHEGVTMWKLNSSYWNAYNNNLSNRNVQAIVKVQDELVIGNDMGIFKSSGHMQSWTGKHIGEQCVSLNITGDTLYAGTVKGVMMSKDAGETWIYVNKRGSIHTTTIQDNRIFASYTSGNLYMSDNWGRSWKEIQYSPRDQSFIYDLVKAGDHYLMSNNHGVFQSMNGVRDWQLVYPAEKYWFVDLVEDEHMVYAATSTK